MSAFGRAFIANPDLVERGRAGHALAALDRATLYGGDAHDYGDYPAWNEHAVTNLAAE